MKTLGARNIAIGNRTKQKIPNKAMYKIMLEEARRHVSESHSLAKVCLSDRPRTFALMQIVADLAREGATALDLGAGCGPLTFAFLSAGGGDVIAVEKSSELCRVIDNCAHIFGFEDRILIYNRDIFDPVMKLPKNIDFVLAELIATGLLSEPMVAAMQHIRPLTHEGTLFIPEKAVSTITLCDQRGFPISAPETYDFVDMRDVERNSVDVIATLTVRTEREKALATYVDINTSLTYPDGGVTGEFQSLCNRLPMEITDYALQLKQFEVENGEEVKLRIRYEYGEEPIYVTRVI